MQQAVLSKLKTQNVDDDDHFLNADTLPVRTFEAPRESIKRVQNLRSMLTSQDSELDVS